MNERSCHTSPFSVGESLDLWICVDSQLCEVDSRCDVAENGNPTRVFNKKGMEKQGKIASIDDSYKGCKLTHHNKKPSFRLGLKKNLRREKCSKLRGGLEIRD